MFKKIVTFFIFVISFQQFNVFADHINGIDRCEKSDAACVGKVLLDKLNSLEHHSPYMKVEFFNSDHCTRDFLTVVIFTDNASENETRCEKRASQISLPVWGIRINGGECYNISDTSFLNACMKFI